MYKEERFVLAHDYREFSPWLVFHSMASLLLGLCQGSNYGREHMAEQSYSCYGSQEAKKERKEPGSHISFKACPQ
jgi:hypothetical protein